MRGFDKPDAYRYIRSTYIHTYAYQLSHSLRCSQKRLRVPRIKCQCWTVVYDTHHSNDIFLSIYLSLYRASLISALPYDLLLTTHQYHHQTLNPPSIKESTSETLSRFLADRTQAPQRRSVGRTSSACPTNNNNSNNNSSSSHSNSSSSSHRWENTTTCNMANRARVTVRSDASCPRASSCGRLTSIRTPERTTP